ncbi:di-heme-cytochrome C peroxidase [Methylocella silvestris]|uniref:Cytochrome c domain-containing protein n=1 Tax=Methylocella silvestris TaxID=199596 RepID=A0A2J7TKW8_METSI|nr:di-heme-cytochrome C peroxidase [Methylocella silvestris]PNG27416.1 hypothetical protein CR492_00235 [Methylocella silvestris]
MSLSTRISAPIRILRFAAAISACLGGPCAAQAKDRPLVWLDQGKDWEQARTAFYSQDQGSRIIALAWLKALKRGDGSLFLGDGLTRYGYLPNPENSNGLPVGFHTASFDRVEYVGMTCAACHTRQISVAEKDYRIDGGPAIVDFQSFLSDLDAAVGAVLASEPAFAEFAAATLGSGARPEAITALRAQVADWYYPYHTLISIALKDVNWGFGRLDAVSMIFNRLTGLDLGASPHYVIEDNIKKADAPVRYPFLWNAAKQDKTQWPGFSDNGSDLLGLPRNLGEVFGVFAIFHPQPNAPRFLKYDYVANNSANFDGLTALETYMKTIEPPRWPWKVDQALVSQGAVLFEANCAKCHGKRDGQVQFPNEPTWRTTLQDAGSDRREWDILRRTVDPGVLTGAEIPGLVKPLKLDAYAVDVLAVAVLGSIAQNYVKFPANPVAGFGQWVELLKLRPSLAGLDGLFQSLQNIRNLSKNLADATPGYEARVLQGIWAAAPYLHNGSVATLKDLLETPDKRKASFKVGPAYDVEAVGLAAEQPAGASTLQTTDCSDLHSGESRCGHVYGVNLDENDKKALLEYLKTL